MKFSSIKKLLDQMCFSLCSLSQNVTVFDKILISSPPRIETM